MPSDSTGKDEDKDSSTGLSASPSSHHLEKEDSVGAVSFFQLFKFSTKFELFLNLIGIFAAICAGAAPALSILIFGEIVNIMVNYEIAISQSQSNPEAISEAKAQFIHDANGFAGWIATIAAGIFLSVWAYMYIWNFTGERTAKRIRELYFRAILRQDISYFDNVRPGELTAHVETDTHLIQEGLSGKNGVAIAQLSNFVTDVAVAYARSWRLALATTSMLPCIFIAGGIMAAVSTRSLKSASTFISDSMNIAEEVFSSIRTVHSLGRQHTLSALYDKPVGLAHKFELKIANVTGLCLPIFMFIVYAQQSLAIYFGTTLTIDGQADIGIILTVVFALIQGCFAFAQIAVELKPLLHARTAAANIFATIDRIPLIDIHSSEGSSPSDVQGDITLENVSFHYPSKPDVPIFRNLTLHFPAGKSTALVGASGSGKSTLVALIERFYDPIEGRVTIDGNDIRDLNLKWFRCQIGLVSQEPVLFKASVADNVAMGLIGTPDENATADRKMKLVQEACVKADAESFILTLPQGYNTVVGERGALLSGGQKQRVAIARAIVSDPKVLLLDEATSALDTQSEVVVQAALDKASIGRTTITIAHRLSTIINADKIVVMDKGSVLEQGTHEQLLSNSESEYSKLIRVQRLREGVGSQITKNQISFEEVNEMTKEGDVNIFNKEDTKEDVIDNPHLNNNNDGKINEHKSKKEAAGLTTLLLRLCSIDKSLIKQYAFGIAFSIVQGTVYPAYSILFGKTIIAFVSTDDASLRFEGNRNALWLLVIAMCTTLVIGGEYIFMGRVAANVTRHIRSLQFKSILRQDIKYFDDSRNNTGALVSKLSDNPQKMQGMIGLTLASFAQGASAVVTGVLIGLIFNWKLGLVATACVPFVVSSGYIRLVILSGREKERKKAHEESAQFACEIASAIRTVASLTREDDCLLAYSQILEKPFKTFTVMSLWASVLFGFSLSASQFAVALCFWYGVKLITTSELSPLEFFVILYSILSSAIEVSVLWQYAPDITAAGEAIKDVNKLLDMHPEIDAESTEGATPVNVTGEIAIENIQFRYPTRPEVNVLRGLDLKIEAGSFIALVGASGCGKSTIIQLLERFYDPISGNLLLDNNRIQNYNIQEYRKTIALVSQEPTLYSGTIKFNILLGATKPASDVTQNELENACRSANILEFINSLPKGFDTEVGGKGSQLSGGQKQRIAIARALIRNPKVLLLDEATSALDTQSERVVQAALDEAAKSRTTIAVAHRLSTIQNADRIYFIKAGQISESGTHDALMDLKGHYYEYVQLQDLTKK